MMETIKNFITKVFKINNRNETTDENRIAGTQIHVGKHITLSEVIDFIRELEAYYTSDILKIRSKYMTTLKEDDLIYLSKKVKEYEVAVGLITEIKNKLNVLMQNNTDLMGKTSYSFYNELEDASFKTVYVDAFEIVKIINLVNVIPELDEIIENRLKVYRESWKINADIPKNNSLRIVGRKGNVETYRFGEFKKDIIDNSSKYELLPEQLSAINNMKVQISFQRPEGNKIWIRCSAINRKQLQFLTKTINFPNDWEANDSQEIVYDIVDVSDVEYYIKAMMQLLLVRRPYVVISIINPNSEMLNRLKGTIEIDEQNKKVKIINKMAFLQAERSEAYDDNLQFEYVSKKSDFKELMFLSYRKFISNFL